MSFAGARNEAASFQQELIRAEGQRHDAETAVASLMMDVAKIRAVRVNLEGTVVRLQNEAADKRPP